MSDPRADRDAYLARVSARLRLPPDHEREVLEELEVHLTESIASLVGEGLPAELAERESIARLGDPGELADGIRRARQSRRRLLATAGAGVNAAIGGFFWGYILASALSSVAAVLAAVAVSTMLGWLGLTTSGWSNSAQSFAIPIALFAAGVVAYRMVTAIAARSARRVETLRRPIAVLGGGLLAIVSVVFIRAELDPVRVVSHVAIPIGFAIGALLAPESGTPSPIRWRWRGVAALILVATAIMIPVSLAGTRTYPAGQTFGAVMPMGEPMDGDQLGDGWLNQGSSNQIGVVDITISAEPVDLLDSWRDLRLEIWPALDEHAFDIDPSAVGPAVVAPLRQDEFGSYTATLDLGVSKERRWFISAATGVGPDGTRYLLTGPDGPVGSRPWTGTVWEWFTTP